MQITNHEQGSDDWKIFRRGKIYGTRLGSIWSSRQYTKVDIIKLLENRGVEFKKSLSKKDLEDEYLTEADKEELSQDTEKKMEYYQILADQVAVPRDDDVDASNGKYQTMMDRGTALEDEACQAFATKFNKELLVVGCCVSDTDPRIINSPDRLVRPENLTEIVVEDDKIVLPEGVKVTEMVEAKCLASAKHLMAFFERKVPEEYWTQKVQYFTVNPELQRLYWVFYDPRIAMLPMFVLVIEREDLGHWPETMLKYQLKTLRELDKLTNRLFDESNNILMPAKPEKV